MVEMLTAVGHTQILDRYREVRALTESLAAPLSAEDQTVQSMPDVSPTKWHRAHTSWFFETFLLGTDEGYEPFHPAYAFLFNSYYEGIGAQHPRDERGLLSRPGTAEIAEYRRHVDAAMEGLLANRIDAERRQLVELGLHHEQQHQELLLMDIKHVLSRNPLERGYGELPAPRSSTAAKAKSSWIAHPGGLIEVGHTGDGFAFDNEYPRHSSYLRPFALSDRLVTCGEWLDFMADGGYDRADLWLSDGWSTIREQGWDAPLYWSRADDQWRVFTLGGALPVHRDEPVCHISYYEADAFAHWAGARLPTEEEWEVVADPLGTEGNFLDTDVLHPRAPATNSGSQSPTTGLCGDVWQWTSSAYSPYPGFRPAAGAVGEYNGKFMVGQYVLRGGSCVTPPGHTRATYRNFFPPSARWAFGGLRLARDI
jgi:ergothioneine biosynthesis protein EgtB